MITLRQKITLRAPIEQVWAVVGDPERMAEWNPKVRAFEALSPGPVGPGYRYRVTFELGGRANRMDGEVLEHRPGDRLVVRLTGGSLGEGGQVRESYGLRPRGERVRVHQRIEVRDPNVPWWARLLVRLLTAFGQPQETPTLERLKALVESAGAVRTTGHTKSVSP